MCVKFMNSEIYPKISSIKTPYAYQISIMFILADTLNGVYYNNAKDKKVELFFIPNNGKNSGRRINRGTSYYNSLLKKSFLFFQ